MGNVFRQSTIDEVFRLAETGMSPMQIAKALRVGHVATRNYWRAWKASKDSGVTTDPPVALDEAATHERHVFSDKGETATVNCTTAEPVQTEQDAIRVCRVDLDRWKVVGMTIKTYQVGMKITAGKGQPDTPKVLQLFAVKLDLELLMPKPYLDATEALFRRLETRAPTFMLPPLPGPTVAPYVMLVNLFDCHFGKLCWAPETGDNYDLKIATAVFRNAVQDLLGLTGGFPVGRIVFLVGNDLHHVDTLARTTTAGTPQDADGRYFKMIDVVETSVTWAIELMMQRSFVDAIYMGGNHDRISSWHLCKTLKAYFRNAQDRVDVDVSPRTRKYRRYGRNLFGFAHGHQVRDPRSLVNLMAIEAQQDWADTTCREWHLGHLHTSKSVATQQSNEYNGVMLRWGPSVAGTDAYHFEEGYTGNRRAAEAYLYSMESGFVGYFTTPARLT